MGASSVTGVSGAGSAEAHSKGPQNNRTIYQTLNGPYVVAAGEVLNVDECWQVLVEVAGLTENPDNYTVVVTQSDWSNYDRRPNRVAHIEKLDSEGNNWDDVEGEWMGAMGGFVLHVGDPDNTYSSYPRKFGYIIVRNGGAGASYECY
jgi:hypothetical protein